MKRMYISLPVTSRPEETPAERFKAARRRAIEVMGKLLDDPELSEYSFVTPFHVVPQTATEPKAMGFCIKAVLECDAIYLDEGWEQSDGCRLELAAATIYGKTILQHT